MTLICDDLRNEERAMFFVTTIEAKNDYQVSLEVAREVEFVLGAFKDIRLTTIQLDEELEEYDSIVYCYEVDESTEELYYGDIRIYDKRWNKTH